MFVPKWVRVCNLSNEEQTKRESIRDLLRPAPNSSMEEAKSCLEDQSMSLQQGKVFCARSQTNSPAAPRGVARVSSSRALELPSLLLLHGAERAALEVKPKHSSQARPAIPRERKRCQSHGNDSFPWKKNGYCLESSKEPAKENRKN